MAKEMLKLKYDEIKLNSLILAIVLCSTTLATTLSLRLNITSNGNLYVLVVIFALYLIKFTHSTSRLFRYFNKKAMVLIILVVILFILSKLLVGSKSQYTLIQLLFYAIIPIVSITAPISTKKVCKYVMYLTLLTVLGGNKWFALQYTYLNQGNMGYIYPVVTVLVCALFHFRYYRTEEKNNWLIWLCYLYDVYLLIRTIMVANRGALLVILFTVFVIFLHDFKNDGTKVRMRARTLIIWFLAILIISIAVYNTSELFTWLGNVFSKLFGYVPSTILKMQRYIAYGDISNGRQPIYDVLFPAIWQSPIWGHGMETFKSNTGFAYPHNFILQFLYEGGILFAAIPLFYAIKLPVQVLLGKIDDKDKYILCAILVCQCYPKLVLSTDVWLNTHLWMMITCSALVCYSKKRIAESRGEMA